MDKTFYRLLADGDPNRGMHPSDLTAPETFTTKKGDALILAESVEISASPFSL